MTPDYFVLAEQLVNLQASLHQVPIQQKLSALDRGSFFALNFLMLHQNRAYPKDLSRGMSVSSARVAALLNHLEGQGLILRRPDPSDSRQVIVSLTQAGIQAIRQKRAEIVSTVAQTLEDLGPEDAQAFLRIQQKMVSNFLRHAQQTNSGTAADGRKGAPAKRHE